MAKMINNDFYNHLVENSLELQLLDNDVLRITLLSRDYSSNCEQIIDIPYEVYNDDNVTQLIFDGPNAYDFLYKVEQEILSLNYPDIYYKFNKRVNGNTTLVVRQVNDNAVIPSKSRFSDVGHDLIIISKHKDISNICALYDTGLQVQVPFGYYTEIVPRSSLSKSGYMLANSIGIIDNGYRGNLYIALIKVDPNALPIEFPFKCCQLVLRKQYFSNISVTHDELIDTQRMGGGFGSTG